MTLPIPATPADVPLFEALTSVEVEAAVAAGAPVIVPLGATEQHGSHLPLGTDTYQGVEVARRTIHRLAGEGLAAVLGPVIPFGPPMFLSESPKDRPGTIAISNRLLIDLTDAVVRELVRSGFRTIYLLMANAESDPAMQIVAKEVTEQTPANVVTLNWLVGTQKTYRSGILKSEKPQGHAGEGETARMLVTAPHLVHMERAVSWHPSFPASEVEERMPYLGGAIGRYRYDDESFAGFSDGPTGDPANALPETGEASYRLIVDWVVAVLRSDAATGIARGR
ncbi:creatininase family protein [Acuticoccus mangrovi]|uniref:Creatininase family protein n=1 Tax=Acuticoccus mangrovi TaxID=2796142 RepID=A0A934IJ25_9HYPH|nr:creatininase family protein [Acuticoccus mangrovi]MBJ3774647.1 creatininase family protein [Acuticoccus mangrovi]